ncbi:MAG TPA: hypothetical protein VFB04_04700 [Terriglobales bacterium]|nr:hypothetical protein [Terriglobales bacterium]
MRNAVLLAAAMLSAVLLAQGQQTDQSAVQQKLNSQFQLTQLSSDRNNVVSTGTTLRLSKDGLVMYATSSPMPSSNSYKNGKITQGGGGFGRDLAITMARGGQGTANDLPHHKFTVNDAVWVIKIDVHPNDVTLRLCSNPGDGMLYYGDLKIPYDKGSSPTPEQVLAKIGEVLTAEGGSAPLTQTAAVRPASSASTAELKLPALYVNSQNSGDQLKLNPDKSFQLQEEGQPYHGTFTENGDSIELNITETNSTTTVTLHGNSITDTSGHTWTLHN